MQERKEIDVEKIIIVINNVYSEASKVFDQLPRKVTWLVLHLTGLLEASGRIQTCVFSVSMIRHDADRSQSEIEDLIQRYMYIWTCRKTDR